MSHRTQVGIIGAGPAGMLLAVLLRRAGIDCVVLERRDREYVANRARGATVEHRVVELLRRHDLAGNLLGRGAVENAVEFRLGGRRYPVHYEPLAAGRSHYIYPQQFLVRDLIEAYLADGGDLRFDTAVAAVDDLAGQPLLRLADGTELRCEVIAGCDGEYGVARSAIPATALRCTDYQYGYAWLSVLAEAPPSNDCVINALHESGACVHVRRTPTVSRFYLQCGPAETRADWPDERIWKEIRLRLAVDEPWTLHTGPVTATGTVRMRSLVCEPMRYGSLFLAGDAAHIVPPVGGKGFNLALADAEELALGLIDRFTAGDHRRVDAYSQTRLARIWRAQEFVHWMMDLVNTPGYGTSSAPFLHRVQAARLTRLMDSPEYMAAFLTDYVGW